MHKPFEGVENLEAAYDLETPEDNIKLYADWADTYDTGYRASMDYILHRQVGETYHGLGGGPKVLDIGAGTGALAEVLVPLGPYDMDATDISQQMLDVAAQKDLYRRVFWSDVTDALPVDDATYDGVVSSGTFTLGHVGPEAIGELLRVTKTGGHIVISVNEHHWHALHFERALDAMAEQYDTYETRTVAIYGDSADHEHKDDLARALIIKK
jgi:ubiquinone/menaquinone biosynthesis C-methylase UbiE